jgi:hypothetical protein
MAVDDLMAKFDCMLARPVCQKALEVTTIQKYRLMRNSIGEKLDLLKNTVVPTKAISPLITTQPSLVLSHSPMPSQEQEKIDVVKKRIGDQPPILCPSLFSRMACIEAGAVAGSSMMVAILLSIVFRSFVRGIPIVGMMAIVVSFVRRQGLVTARAKRCAVAEDLYKKATTGNDILNIFPLLTRYAQAQFLVGLDSEFRGNVIRRYSSLKNICTCIDAFLSCCPESLERVHALANFPKEGLGKEVVQALAKYHV